MKERRPATAANRVGLRRGISRALALAALLVAPSAGATPDFPATVDQTLMLTRALEKVFPDSGCRLCHPTESPPPSNPPLKPFGQLLFSYGAIPYNDDSLNAALALVKTNEPWLIEDLQAGMDPNLDSRQPKQLPSPEYGCSTTPGAGSPSSWGWVMALLMVPVLVRARRRAGLP